MGEFYPFVSESKVTLSSVKCKVDFTFLMIYTDCNVNLTKGGKIRS